MKNHSNRLGLSALFLACLICLNFGCGSSSEESANVTSPLMLAIDEGMKPEADVNQMLASLGKQVVTTPQEAAHINQALKQLPLKKGKEQLTTRFYALTAMFQQVKTDQAYQELKRGGIPELCRLVDSNLASNSYSAKKETMFALKILALYQTAEGTDRVSRALRDGYESDSYTWSVILGQYSPKHPHLKAIMSQASAALPTGFAAIALLDCANANSIGGADFEHPFDTPAGKSKLGELLSDTNPDHVSYAHSATAAIPFVSNPERGQLLGLASRHFDRTIQLEAAWAAGKLGDRRGIEALAQFCLDPIHTIAAAEYLHELGHAEAVPEKAKEPGFLALATMSQWLSHPQEFGKAPDEITVYDQRTMFWPPTNDKRPVWLFKYRYKSSDVSKPDKVGIGMVGSITFALSDVAEDLSPLDVYALHCCWELAARNDKRAPEKRSVEAGRALISSANQGMIR